MGAKPSPQSNQSNQTRKDDKFSCTTSRFLLPTFRRPNYKSALKSVSSSEPQITPTEAFQTWTKEDGKLYHTINSALLNDEHSVLDSQKQYIHDLKTAIRNHHMDSTITVYRGLKLDPESFTKEYKVGQTFLWPTFSCTSLNKDVASSFGGYTFVIDAPGSGLTYCADLSPFSVYPHEQEVLFYPYSGFIVENIVPDAKVVKLNCVDTLMVEEKGNKEIPDDVTLYDSSRNMCVYFSKSSSDLTWSTASDPDTRWLIGQNMNGYWDAPYRYHHRNGYFVNTGVCWEEWQDGKLWANFVQK